MNILIDPTAIFNLSARHPFFISIYLIKIFGWVPIIFIIFWGLWRLWMNFIQDEFAEKIKYIILAIDVPKDNRQYPKAVEQIFAQLAGAHANPNFVEKYWEGSSQPGFSLEVISIDGYVQFLIHTPEMFRDLVEAAVYAQYPDSEIVEVEDYTGAVPHQYPDDSYDLWGSEIIPVKSDCYPLRTYQEFEHSLSEDMKDPMAALLEIMSALNQGEQVWVQIKIIPIDQDWTKKCAAEVKKLIKEAVPVKRGPIDAVFDSFLGALHGLADSAGEGLLGLGGVAATEKKEREQLNIVQNMTEGDKDVVASIQRKAAKIGYECKMRMIYLAKNEVFSKTRGVSGVFGAIKQFNTNDKNALKPEKTRTTTKVNYFFKKKREAARKTKIMKAYSGRSMHLGSAKTFILNIEELATLWHFPMFQVKAPLIKKTEVKKTEPPFNLPINEDIQGGMVLEEENNSGIAVEEENNNGHKDKNDDSIEQEGEQKQTSEAPQNEQEQATEAPPKDEPPSNLPFE